MKIEVLLMTLMVGLVLGVNGDCHPILAPKRNSNLNPVLLSLTYCSNSSKFQSYDATDIQPKHTFMGLSQREHLFQYKIVDVRSKLEYFFDKAILLKEESNIEDDYPFLMKHKNPLLLLLHRRDLNGPDGYTRYFIIGSQIKKDSKLKDNGAFTGPLNSLFHGVENMTRYSGYLKNTTNCAKENPYVFIYFGEKLLPFPAAGHKGLSQNDKWEPGTVDPTHGEMEYVEEKGNIRFDCQRFRSPFNQDNGSDIKLKNKFGFIHMSLMMSALANVWITSI